MSFASGGSHPEPVLLGPYQLLRKIAAGGMAELYLARRHDGGDPVVVKRILPQLADSDELLQMFIDEARIAAALDHPNVVRTIDAREVEGEYFIVMEHLDGADLQTLRKRLADQRLGLPIRHSVFIVMSIAAGLSYVHAATDREGRPLGIIHRDVTPQNIFLSQSGAVKLVDFGIAKAANRATQTNVGTLKGKISYMSPEQADSRPLDRRSDIYSLAIVLFELTTGKLMYRGQSELEILRQISERDAPTPSSVLPGYPQDLELIVNRALARDPVDRYSTAMDLYRDLEQFVTRRSIQGSQEELSAFLQPHLKAIAREREERWKRHTGQSLRPIGRTPRPEPVQPPPSRPAQPVLQAAQQSRAPLEPWVLDLDAVDESLTGPAPDFADMRVTRRGWIPIAVLLLILCGAGAFGVWATRQTDRAIAPATDAGESVQAHAPTWVHVTTEPPGAAVWMRVGRAPATTIALDPHRSHTVRVERTGYQTEQIAIEPKHFRTTAGKTVAEVQVDLETGSVEVSEPTEAQAGPAGEEHRATATIEVTSSPPAATVWLLVGVTPTRVGPLAPDYRGNWRLGKDDHLPQFINIEPGSERQVHRDLPPRP